MSTKGYFTILAYIGLNNIISNSGMPNRINHVTFRMRTAPPAVEEQCGGRRLNVPTTRVGRLMLPNQARTDGKDDRQP